ncbi:MAG: DUF6616 family protein [Actinomycetota bacterium]
MYTFIELYSLNDKWLALGAEDREALVSQIGDAVEQLADAGVTSLGIGINDADTSKRADYDYVGVWQAPDLASITLLEAGIAASGWYDYVEQVNGRSTLLPPEEILVEHLSR